MKKFWLILAPALFLFPICKTEGFLNGLQPGWDIQGELLYFKAVADNTAFINHLPGPVLGGTEITARRSTNDPNYRPGFRIEIDWMCCDRMNQIQFRYANLYCGGHKTVTGLISPLLLSPFVVMAPIDPTTGQATSKLGIHYNAADLVWQRYLFNCPSFDLAFLVGVHLAFTKYSENFEVMFATGTVPPVAIASSNWRSIFGGAGPEFGLTAHYVLPGFRSLVLVADARGTLLAGRVTSSFREHSGFFPSFTFENHPNNWSAIAAFDGRLGASYFLPWFCWDTIVEIGYEILWYSRAVDKIVFTSSVSTTTTELLSALSFHGPYAAFRISF